MNDFINRRFLRGVRWWKPRSAGERFEAWAGVVLRVPGYLVLNSWWHRDLANSVPRSAQWADVVSAGFAAFVMVQGLLLLLLPLRRLVTLYMHYVAVALLAAMDTFSRGYVAAEAARVADQPGYELLAFQGFSGVVIPHRPLFGGDPFAAFLRHQLSAIVFHTLAALGATLCLDLGDSKGKVVLLVYYLPVFARLCGAPVKHLHSVHTFASCFVLLLVAAYIFLHVPAALRAARHAHTTLSLKRTLYGDWQLLLRLARRLFVPLQVLVFWLFQYVCSLHAVHADPAQPAGGSLQRWLVYPAAAACNNGVMLVATCVAVTYAARAVLRSVVCVVAGAGPRHPQHHGTSEGVAMLVLSLQTSLHSTPLPDRYGLLSVLLLIVSSSLIQSTFEAVEPHVVALSARGVAPLSRHVRVVATCVTLFVLPMYMVYVFNRIFEHDFWLLLVMSSSGMIAVQVLGLLVTYCLLTYDSLCCEEWPGLDDVVYYSRATSRAVEFMVAVVVVSAGVKDAALSTQPSPMNLVILLVYFYFNVFDRLRLGWKSFLQRLESVKKISALPQASVRQLKAYNDVCAICYSAMSHGCVTPCQHVFHAPCLRKWLYVQDRCPLCLAGIDVPQDDIVPQADTAPQADTVPQADVVPQADTVPQADVIPQLDAVPRGVTSSEEH